MSHHPSRKIVLVIATLGAGGAERVMTLLAGEWVRRGNGVTIITLGDAQHDHYEQHPDVKRIGLNLLQASKTRWQVVSNNLSRILNLRRAIKTEKPDVIISFMDSTNVTTLLATARLRVPVIVSERIDPRYYAIPAGWARLRKSLYPKAAAVVVQTSAVAEWARGFVPPDRVAVIPNPVKKSNTDSADENLPEWLPAPGYILAMGRLDRQKGFDLLLHAYAQLPDAAAAPLLVILGEGPERSALENLADKLQIADRVLMPGRVSDPRPVLASAQIFVLSSRFEGFPNALLEAMAAGLPVVSFDCPSGPADIMCHNENGLLVPAEDIKQLAQAMAHLLQDKELRDRLGMGARQVACRFSLTSVVDQWEEVINSAQCKREKRHAR